MDTFLTESDIVLIDPRGDGDLSIRVRVRVRVRVRLLPGVMGPVESP